MRVKSVNEIPAELAQLGSLSLDELRRYWSDRFGAPPPRTARRAVLMRGIAYRLQEQIFGGLSPSTRRRLGKLAEELRSNPKHVMISKQKLKPGSRILREWQGEMHEVAVLEPGFRYRDRTYKSLSEIARLITGTRWSGPVFFGLKPGAGAATSNRGRKRPVELADGALESCMLNPNSAPRRVRPSRSQNGDGEAPLVNGKDCHGG